MYGLTNIGIAFAQIFRHIPARFRPDKHMLEVMRGGTEALVLRALGAALGFGFNVLLAHMLGAEGAGVYYLALSVTAVASVVGRMGLDNTLLRFVASHATQENWAGVAGVYRKGIGFAVGASIAATIAIFSGAAWIANGMFSNPLLTEPLRWMALSILPLNLIMLYGEMLRGLKKIRGALILQGVGIPFLSLLLLAWLAKPLGIIGAAVSYVVASILVLILGITLWQQAAPQIRGLVGSFDTRILIATSIPLLWVALMNLVMGMADTIMLGIWTDSRSIGIYGVAVRTGSLTSFILVAVNTIIAPKFAALYAQRDFQALGRLARDSARLMALISLPLLLVFILAPVSILEFFFGAEFRSGAAVLAVVAIGQFVNAAAGSVGYLLIMTGHEKLVRNNAVFSALLNVALLVVLIPRIGILGAAIATTTTLIVTNLISVGLVSWKLSINTLPIPFVSQKNRG